MKIERLTTHIAQRTFELLRRGANLIGAIDGSYVGHVTATYPAVTGDGLGRIFAIRRAFAAGAPGATDVPIFDATHPCPCDLRITDVLAYISGGAAGTLTLIKTHLGAPTNVSDAIATAALGVKRTNFTTATVAITTLAKGDLLTAQRSDNGLVGEVIVLCEKVG
jgi:hypothetical protein